ncbi:MAG: hypothetical protein KBD46_00445 [Candidatus Levybacteria bacterium]|nr:hypothetical protein [Candidatus Levybacteria bacterium]
MPDLFIKPKEEQSTIAPAGGITDTNPSDVIRPLASSENHIHALAQFCVNPKTLILEGKNVAGQIKLFVRRHIITNVPWIFTTLVLLLIPFLIQILLTITNTPLTNLPQNFIMIFLLFYYLISFTYAFVNFINWFYNIIIITNTEIIDIDYSDVIYHDVAATNVNLIEDVNYTQLGFIRGLFNFGDLFVQTAGGKENIEALAIPKPASIARLILDFIGKGEND